MNELVLVVSLFVAWRLVWMIIEATREPSPLTLAMRRLSVGIAEVQTAIGEALAPVFDELVEAARELNKVFDDG